MKELTYSIAADVFARFPEYRRGVVLAFDVRNGASPLELVGMLRDEEAAARERLNVETLTAEPRLASWREAFRRLGYKPGDFRPSIEALLRRVLRGQELPVDQRPGRHRQHRLPAPPAAGRRPRHRRPDPGHRPAPGFRGRGIRRLRFGGDRASGSRGIHFRRGRPGPDPALDLAPGQPHPDPAGDDRRRDQHRRPAAGDRRRSLRRRPGT